MPVHTAPATNTPQATPFNFESTSERACPLCSQPAKPLSLDDHSLVACASCGLHFRTHKAGPIENEYWSEYIDNAREQHYDTARQSFYKSFWRFIRRFPNTNNPHPEVLDIGCVPGMLLREAKADCWNISGVELSEDLCQSTAKFCNANMYLGRVENIDFQDKRFDLITFSDVFRHVDEPSKALTKCRQLLTPGGALVIREINASHPKHQPRIAKPYPFDMQVSTPKNMIHFLQEAGFASVTIHNSPVSLLTIPSINKLHRRSPRTYQVLLGCINACIRVYNRLTQSNTNIRTPSFIAVAKTRK